MRTFLISLALCTSAATALAKDMGVQGTVWPIVERDIRQLMIEQAAEVEWSKVQEDVKEGAQKYLDNLPKRRLAVVDQTRTDWMDPSVVLTSDIQAPVKQADGSFAWQVLAPKGARVNPLIHMRPVTAMLFFDGADAEQVALVEEALKLEPQRLVPVEAGMGSVRESHERFKRPVFHGNDSLVNRFQVRHLPALVYPGYGERALYLGITSFGRPFSPQEVLSAWPELTPSQPSENR